LGKTSLMKRYFEPFQKEFLEPLNEEVRHLNRDENEQQAAIVGEFLRTTGRVPEMGFTTPSIT
jgi:hypothetical protein